ncbi:hypothetical protein JCM3766R1_004855 [Sporobolomyces carnicolor]
MQSSSTTTVSSRIGGGERPAADAGAARPRLRLPRHVSPRTGYTFPSLYSFPPFFTKQPNEQTWQHQRRQWSDLILSYARFTKTFHLSLAAAGGAIDNPETEFEPFHNRDLNRTLARPVALEILKDMTLSNPPTVEFISSSSAAAAGSGDASKQPTACYLWWKSPRDWSDTIYEWVRATGQTNSILTLYELTENDPSLEFYKMPEPLLRRVLDLLQKQGKCQVLKGTLGEEGDGVKFV